MIRSAYGLGVMMCFVIGQGYQAVHSGLSYIEQASGKGNDKNDDYRCSINIVLVPGLYELGLFLLYDTFVSFHLIVNHQLIERILPFRFEDAVVAGMVLFVEF